MTAVTNDAILLASAGVPVILLVLLRINGALAFLSLCAGSVLLTYAGSDTGLLASTLSSSSKAEPLVRAAILLLPLILCFMFLRHSVSAAKGLFNILPAACAGVLGALLVVPVLPGGVSANMMATESWRLLTSFQEVFVLGGVVFCMLFLLFSKHHEHKLKKHH